MADPVVSLPREEMFPWLRRLGYDPNEVRDVYMDPGGFTVTHYRVNERGARYHDGENPATVTTRIPFDDDGVGDMSDARSRHNISARRRR